MFCPRMICDVLCVDRSALYSMRRYALLLRVALRCRVMICYLMRCHDLLGYANVGCVMLGYVM
eukprot:592567-Pyramimonas_sp.AAC.1